MDWTPPNWVYNCFPLPVATADSIGAQEPVAVVSLDFLLRVMHVSVDACTEWDSAPLGPVLHMAHMLVCHQGKDGLWASALNLKTGDDVGEERTAAPVTIFQRLNEILGSTEFDSAIRRAKAGISL